jgi:hypothetical protein
MCIALGQISRTMHPTGFGVADEMEPKTVACKCMCGVAEFTVRLNEDEQVGLVTCSAGHHSFLLDSRDYWADVLQNGRPRQIQCRCKGKLFRVELIYDFRADGDVRFVYISPICSACNRERRGVSVKINYGPTAELVSKPLDPIQRPWLRAKTREINSYWKPADAEQFARYLTENLAARMFRGDDEMQECEIHEVEFYPQLKYDLFFTNVEDFAPEPGRDPHKRASLLRLTVPFHMMWPSGLALLHYIQWAEELLRGTDVTKQPESFLLFAKHAREWLRQNYLNNRGANCADCPAEYERIAVHLRR